MCVCMYVCYICMLVGMYVCMCKRVCIYVCMCVYMYVCMHVRMLYVGLCVCVCVYIYICMCVCMNVPTYALIYLCVCVYECVCVYHAPMSVGIILDWGCLRRMCLTNVWTWEEGRIKRWRTWRYEVIHRADCWPDIVLSPGGGSRGLYGRGGNAAPKCSYIYSLVESTAFPASPLFTERTVTGHNYFHISCT